MENYEKPIQFADLNENKDSPEKATSELPYMENKISAFEPQIVFPNQPLTADSYFGYIKLETTRLLMFSTAIRYLVLFKMFLSLLYLACIELFLAFFIPVILLELIGYCSSKALNRNWSIVYLVFLILSFCARVFGIFIIIQAYKMYERWYNDCMNDYDRYEDEDKFHYYWYNCSYYLYIKRLLIQLLTAFLLVLVYEIFQIILQFKFVRALKNLIEENKKVVLEMIKSRDTSLCFCCRFNK